MHDYIFPSALVHIDNSFFTQHSRNAREICEEVYSAFILLHRGL